MVCLIVPYWLYHNMLSLYKMLLYKPWFTNSNSWVNIICKSKKKLWLSAMCELSQSLIQMFRIRSQIDFKRAMTYVQQGMWNSQCDAVNGFLDWHLGDPSPPSTEVQLVTLGQTFFVNPVYFTGLLLGS